MITDREPKFRTYDPNLRSNAFDNFAFSVPVGPKGRGPSIQKYFFKFKKYYGLEKNIKASDAAYAWVLASKSSTGYGYVEFQDNDNGFTEIRREVENLNKTLNVEGFENVVTRKQTYEHDSDGNQSLVSEEFWQYRTVENSDGTTEVQYEHFKISTKDGENSFERSGWKTAEPSKNKPED